MWCPCKVLRVADGKTDKGQHGQQDKTESNRAQKLTPAGALLVEWEPDPDRDEHVASVMWVVVHPDRWAGKGANGHLAWRWHPEELAAREAARSSAQKGREE